MACAYTQFQVPGLAVVIVGERKDSQTYVRMKRKACEEVGIASFGADLPETATQQEVLDVVQQLNSNPDVHGILVQLPVSIYRRVPVCSNCKADDAAQGRVGHIAASASAAQGQDLEVTLQHACGNVPCFV